MQKQRVPVQEGLSSRAWSPVCQCAPMN